MALKKPWLKSEWKARRKQLMEGKACAQCGSHENLVIHHTHQARWERKRQLSPIINALIREKMNAGVLPPNYEERVIMRCPECGTSTKLPRRASYKTGNCEVCGLHVELSKTQVTRAMELNTYLGRAWYVAFVKKYESEINARAAAANIPEDPEYTDLTKDTIILCKRCHFALHHGMDLCPVCHKKYKRRDYASCYECLPSSTKQQIQQWKTAWQEMEDEEAEFFKHVDELEKIRMIYDPNERERLGAAVFDRMQRHKKKDA